MPSFQFHEVQYCIDCDNNVFSCVDVCLLAVAVHTSAIEVIRLQLKIIVKTLTSPQSRYQEHATVDYFSHFLPRKWTNWMFLFRRQSDDGYERMNFYKQTVAGEQE